MAACEQCGNAGYLHVRNRNGSFRKIPCDACSAAEKNAVVKNAEEKKMVLEQKDKGFSGSLKSTGKLVLDETLDAAKLELASRAADGLHLAAKAGYRRVFGRDWPAILDSGPGAAAMKVLVPVVLRTTSELYGDSIPFSDTIKNVSEVALRGVTRQAVKDTVQLAMPFIVDIVAISASLMAGFTPAAMPSSTFSAEDARDEDR